MKGDFQICISLPLSSCSYENSFYFGEMLGGRILPEANIKN